MNFISLVGKLRDRKFDKKTRILETNRIDGVDPIEVPVRYWTNDESNYLTSLKNGSLVIIRGRIDSDDKIGLFVVVERIEILK